jgi:hypothetical protein
VVQLPPRTRLWRAIQLLVVLGCHLFTRAWCCLLPARWLPLHWQPLHWQPLHWILFPMPAVDHTQPTVWPGASAKLFAGQGSAAVSRPCVGTVTAGCLPSHCPAVQRAAERTAALFVPLEFPAMVAPLQNLVAAAGGGIPNNSENETKNSTGGLPGAAHCSLLPPNPRSGGPLGRFVVAVGGGGSSPETRSGQAAAPGVRGSVRMSMRFCTLLPVSNSILADQL